MTRSCRTAASSPALHRGGRGGGGGGGGGYHEISHRPLAAGTWLASLMTGAGEERSGVYRVWSRHSDRSSLKQVAEISFSVQGGFAAEKGCHPPDGDFHRSSSERRLSERNTLQACHGSRPPRTPPALRPPLSSNHSLNNVM
ncbi:uncharacterized protein LOC119005221 isoform X3 [Acanthopagrus latus]|uniref:uncharacterized protein LOC119005221 isoform X3 n=1 Tax=Acanthopagrus latus TaxID=8177 RepID=UPI00187CD178|nr:uncharacterized protein LOC119005221 isoform X3 [Acanthopagrus latus]